MAGKTSASKAKSTTGPKGARPRPEDEKLLQRMAALVSAHPDMDISEAFESIGIEDLVGQRRLRKQFEARRDELLGAAETRRDRRPKDAAQPTKAAALQAAKEPRVSSPPVEERGKAGAGNGTPTDMPPRLADTPRLAPAARMVAQARGMAAALPLCGIPGAEPEKLALPWVKAGLDAVNTGLRIQSAMIDAWLRLPPVSMVLSQQAAAYNALLGLAASTLPKQR